MASELPARSGVDLQGITSLANLFLGKSGTQATVGGTQNTGGVTTTGTRTVSENVSQDAIDATVKSILEGNQGLAAVSAGENKVGLYNSSTNRMLTNDLIARAAAEGAKLNKTQTTQVNETAADTRGTSTNTAVKTTAAPQVKPGTAAVGLLGIQGLSALSNTTLGKKLMAQLGMGAGVKAAAGAAGASGSDSSGGASTNATANTPNAPVASIAADGSSTADMSSGTRINNPSAYVAPGGEEQSVQSFSPDTNVMGSGPVNLDAGGDLSFDQTADFSGFDMGTGVAGGADVSQSFDGDAGLGNISEMGGVTGDWGVDPGSIEFTDNNTDFSDLFNFAHGGLVTKEGNHNLVQAKAKYAGGGYVNIAAEKAFESGGDEKKPDSGPNYTDKDSGVNFFKGAKSQTAGNDPRAAEAQQQQVHKSLAVKLIDKLTGRDKIPGYATGGMVDITNVGLRAQDNPNIAGTIAGEGEQSASAVKKNKEAEQDGSVGSQSKATNVGGTTATNSVRVPEAGSRAAVRMTRDSNLGGLGDATSNSAADSPSASSTNSGIGSIGSVAGAIGSAAGLSGMGSVGGLASATSNNAAVASVAGAIATAVTANPAVGMVVSALIGNSGTGSSTPGVDADAANAAAAISDTDPMDAFMSQIDAALNGGNTAAAAAPGSVGDSSGAAVGDSGGNSVGADGDGGVGAGGGDGGGWKRGGKVSGPGTSTSDSIDAKLSDGEYVINAAAVDHFGKDFFDMINNNFKVKM